MATPALRALRRGRPDAHIRAVVRRSLAPVLRGSPWIDGFVAARHLRRRRASSRKLRARLAVGARAARQRPRRWCCRTRSRARSWPSPRARRAGSATRAAAATSCSPTPCPRRASPAASCRPRWSATTSIWCARSAAPTPARSSSSSSSRRPRRECDARFAAAGISGRAPLVCLAPGAGFGPSKLWPLAYVAEVARELRADGAQVALVHGPGEEPLADEIVARAGAGTRLARRRAHEPLAARSRCSRARSS